MYTSNHTYIHDGANGQVKLLPVTPASHMSSSLTPNTPFPIQFTANVPGKKMEDVPIP